MDKDAAITDREKDLEWHRNMLERYREAVRSKNAKIKSLETEIGKMQSSYKLIKQQYDTGQDNGDTAIPVAHASTIIEQDEELLYRSSGYTLNRSSRDTVHEYKTSSLVLSDYRTFSNSIETDEDDMKIQSNFSNTQHQAHDSITCQQELARTKQMCQNREQEIAGLQRIIVALRNESNTYRRKEHDNLLKQASMTREITLLTEKLRIQPFDEKRMFESEQTIAMKNSNIEKLESDMLMLQHEGTVHQETIQQLKTYILELESASLELRGEKDSMEHMLHQSRAVSSKAFQELDEMKMKQSTLQEQLQLMTQKEQENESLRIDLQEAQACTTQLEQELRNLSDKHKEDDFNLNTNLKEAQSRVAQLEEELQKLSDKHKEEDFNLNTSLKEAQSRIAQLEAELQNLSDIHKEDDFSLTTSLKEAQSRIAQLEAELQYLPDKSNDDDFNMNTSLKEAQSRIAQLQAELQYLPDKSRDDDFNLNTCLKEAQSRITQLEAELQNLSDKHKEDDFSLNTSLKEAQSRIAQLEAELQYLPDKSNDDDFNLNTSVMEAQSRITQLEAELQNLSDKHKEDDFSLNTSLKEDQSLIAQLEAELQNLPDKPRDDDFNLNTSLEEAQSRVAQLEAELRNLSDKYKEEDFNLNTSLEKAQSCIAQLEAELHNLSGKHMEEDVNLSTSLKEAQSRLSQLEDEQQRLLEKHKENDFNSHISLQEAQKRIAQLEEELKYQADKLKEEEEVGCCAQLSSEESTEFEDELIVLREENTILSYDIIYLKNELAKLSNYGQEMIHIQDEIKSLQTQLEESQQQCQEHENALHINEAKRHKLECEITELRAKQKESNYGSLLTQSQAKKENNIIDQYTEEMDAVFVESASDLHASRHCSNISKFQPDTLMKSKSLLDIDYDDDLDSRYGPLDEKDDIFFQHYTEIISDLKLKIEFKDNEIMIMKGTIKNKDETITRLKTSLDQVQDDRKIAEALALMEIEERSLASKQTDMVLKTQASKAERSKEISDTSVIDPASEDSMHMFTNTMLAGLTSLKDIYGSSSCESLR